jgi:hypothetical protein
MLTADKANEGLLISLLEDSPEDVVGDRFLTSDEGGHLLFTQELDGAARETSYFRSIQERSAL